MEPEQRYFCFKDKYGNTHIADFYNIKKASAILRALNHPGRLQILILLATGIHNTVTKLILATGMEQSLVSQNLAALRRAGIVVNQRIGKNLIYSLNTNRIAEIYSCILKINNCHLTAESWS